MNTPSTRDSGLPNKHPEHSSGWQPIETAPRDGTPVLLATPTEGGGYRRSVGLWDEEFATDGWDEAKSDTIYRAAWTDFTVASWCYEEYAEINPTHWQPLPEPPEASHA